MSWRNFPEPNGCIGRRAGKNIIGWRETNAGYVVLMITDSQSLWGEHFKKFKSGGTLQHFKNH
jgi:hypothetical protein